MTESEKIAIETIVGIVPIAPDFYHFLEGFNDETKQKILSLRDKIDGVSNDLKLELNDLRYQVKELLYRIEERRDVRGDEVFKELKHNLNVA